MRRVAPKMRSHVGGANIQPFGVAYCLKPNRVEEWERVKVKYRKFNLKCLKEQFSLRKGIF